jgi:iron(III) transport system substrate-binding protein
MNRDDLLKNHQALRGSLDEDSTVNDAGKGGRIMRARRLVGIAVVFMWTMTFGGPASAQDARLEAAKKEGKVVWYSSLAVPSTEKLAKMFEAAYPGIKVEAHRTGSQRVLQRVMQELQANINNADIVHTSDAGHFVLLKEKNLLMKYAPAGVEKFPSGFKDKDGYYYGLRASLSAIAFNPKVISPTEAPKNWKDLLDPKWRGKLVTAHPGYSGFITTHILALVNLYGWDYFKQLAQNKLMIVQSANDPAQVVASGERPITVNGAEYFFYKTKKKGNPIEIVYPKEGVPLVVSPTAITSFAPHPNAAKLFTDFIFTKEVQQVLADSEGLYTGHPEVKYPADKPKMSELKLLPADPEELEKRNQEIKDRFVEFFGA